MKFAASRRTWARIMLALWMSSGMTAQAVFAHGTKHGKHDATGPYKVEQKPFGIAGDPKKLTRTVIMSMDDSMRYTPAEVTVKQGDTIRFVLRNDGKLLHEWVIGTDAELAEHAELMRKFPAMEHNEVHMVHVSPGEMEEVTWHFNRAGSFKFACLMPGHFDAGMTGKIKVKP